MYPDLSKMNGMSGAGDQQIEIPISQQQNSYYRTIFEKVNKITNIISTKILMYWKRSII